MLTATDVLRKTRENLLTFGWIQGSYGDEKRGYCLDGALMAATYGVDTDPEAPLYMRARQFITDEVTQDCLNRHVHVSGITTWNDHYAGSREGVLELLDRAITASEQDSEQD